MPFGKRNDHSAEKAVICRKKGQANTEKSTQGEMSNPALFLRVSRSEIADEVRKGGNNANNEHPRFVEGEPRADTATWG